MIVYRVEKPNSTQGLWYTADGELNPIVQKLGLACATLDMTPDPEVYKKDGVAWYSGCDSVEALYTWFSKKEMKFLQVEGFKLFMFNSELVLPHYGHVIFSKQHLLAAQEISLEMLL